MRDFLQLPVQDLELSRFTLLAPTSSGEEALIQPVSNQVYLESHSFEALAFAAGQFLSRLVNGERRDFTGRMLHLASGRLAQKIVNPYADTWERSLVNIQAPLVEFLKDRLTAGCLQFGSRTAQLDAMDQTTGYLLSQFGSELLYASLMKAGVKPLRKVLFRSA